MRLTARDSVHILHYDTSPSLLVQVKGRKLVRTPLQSAPNTHLTTPTDTVDQVPHVGLVVRDLGSGRPCRFRMASRAHSAAAP